MNLYPANIMARFSLKAVTLLSIVLLVAANNPAPTPAVTGLTDTPAAADIPIFTFTPDPIPTFTFRPVDQYLTKRVSCL